MANRQTWAVRSVGGDGTVWATERATGHRPRSVRLPAEYVAEHTHLAYAATVHGVQGITVTESHTVVGDAMGAAGVYVGMTRGRYGNRLHLVAVDTDNARVQFVLATMRDRADRGLTSAATAARDRVIGLTIDVAEPHVGTSHRNVNDLGL